MSTYSSKEELIQFLKDNHIWLKKTYGQHFLIDPNYINEIIKAGDIKPTDIIVEVGPGLGILTAALSSAVPEGKVIAIEADAQLVDNLRNKGIGQRKNVSIIHDNALHFDWSRIKPPYKVIANLPYNVGSPLLYSWLVTTNNPPISIVVMLQREVVKRLTAKPGSSDRGLPTIMVELAGKASIVINVPREAFFPIPKVDSAVIKIDSIIQDPDRLAILKMAKAGFANKRRTLLNSLSGSLHLPKDMLYDVVTTTIQDPNRRAESLDLKEWHELTQKIKSKLS